MAVVTSSSAPDLLIQVVHWVVPSIWFSNSNLPLERAIKAYRALDLQDSGAAPPARVRHVRHLRLGVTQVAELVAQYHAGATAAELAERFGINRNTVSAQLHRVGAVLRGHSPTEAQATAMVQLYDSGLSLVRVGEQVGFDATTVLRYIRAAGVQTRDAHGRERSS